ncbi:SpoIIE family protein phosphatase [Streptomyces sp. SID8366]|uniref:SpoIIE family protein phosphatase n=1 Tax=unclassified Streptomyces TaxID=2593676 RepID=UPI000DBA070A|nr:MULTISPECIES: SpoIIE family protein phosphatase [unclassified Streptomyces]MYU05848.1 SpoIIE family protein phosphatase [Streptomyces sp. SID8366]RAJ63904.1 serine phosphatase RsbU (regulator of sigma subunit) [Streptomyces sp. PsTaAH-130]
MAGSGERAVRTRARLAALLANASVAALRAAGGRVAGVYLRADTPGFLRLAVLSGLPGPLFRPWWRVHVDRPLPVCDAYRLGLPVVLANATEAVRRYPQFAAALPFPFASVHMPVPGGGEPLGVLAVLRPVSGDDGDEPLDRELLARLAEGLGTELRALAGGDRDALVWDGEPQCVRPPAVRPPQAAVGRFTWDPGTHAVRADDRLHTLLGLAAGDFAGTGTALAQALAPAEAYRVLAALRDTAAGRPPGAPLSLRAADGAPRLLDLWAAADDGALPCEAHGGAVARVGGVVFDPGRAALADGAADQLPQGVLCLDRLGVIVYANAAAARFTGRAREALLGRTLWDALPWLTGPPYDDHLRGALLSPEPVHFHVRRPGGAGGASGEYDGFAVSVHPGDDLLTCTLVPASRMEAPGGPPPPGPGVAAGPATAAAYRPIALAIALTDAVTAEQVSAVVMRELLPAFGGRRLAIYLLQERHLHLAWESGFPPGFLEPFDGVALDARIPAVETLATGRPLFFESMRQLARTYPGLPLDAEEGSRAFLPLIASGRPVGSCVLGFDRPRGFSAEERTVLTALAGLIAHAMERARRYDSEAALARGLQQALLPSRLSAHPRVETAGRYLPGTEGLDVGGDWYDVVESGDGLALVIGDVQGHGVQAAATMGQLRSAVRAFALGDRPPDEVLSGTNHLLIGLDPGQFASCCCLRLDPATGRTRIARAGHPPPLLLSPGDRARRLDIPGGVVLGVDPGARYPVTELVLEPDAILALYTDGLVERAGADIDDGIAELRRGLDRAGAAAARRDGLTLSGVADRLTAAARHADARPDDVALLLARRLRHG